ncbi:MAG: biotin-dependent carboxyltransferase family protein [Saprospiraceae bacterium]|nr:biotin-dependent carboxyltransferase family protein [Saprospiraceae bacterium]
MSLHILKPGLLDTIQDEGRYSYGHLGVNYSGAMDRVGMAMANYLVGNTAGEAVLEMHFPAPEIRLDTPVLLALAGADFSAEVDGVSVPLHTPVLLQAGMSIKFQKKLVGTRCYLAIRGGFALDPWLGSCSTNLAAGAGGWKGRALRTGDVLALRQNTFGAQLSSDEKMRCFPWSANVSDFYPANQPIRFCQGPEYAWLDIESQTSLEKTDWQITAQSNRMGYRLKGAGLQQQHATELVSSAVTPGTIQLLPNGQPIVLMTDSQTTGGYPRIGQVIQADLPRLAQLGAGQSFPLQAVSLDTVFAAFQEQMQLLRRVQTGSALKLAAMLTTQH